MKTHPLKQLAEMWKKAAIRKGLDEPLVNLGYMLIDQALLDSHYKDNRLLDLLGDGWFKSMLVLAQRDPQSAASTWCDMIEFRCLSKR